MELGFCQQKCLYQSNICRFYKISLILYEVSFKLFKFVSLVFKNFIFQLLPDKRDYLDSQVSLDHKK